MRSGIFDATPTARFLMVTLTAPSFGPTHRVAKAGRRATLCGCGATHDSVIDADLRGVPLNIEEYDYEAQVWWNYSAPELRHNLIRRLRDEYPSLAYVALREFQERGAIHFHVLVRVSVRDEPKASIIEAIARSVTARVNHGATVRFGSQVRAEVARADGNIARTVWYLVKAVKYLVKEVATGPSAAGAAARQHFAELSICSRKRLRCRRCPPRSSEAMCRGACHRQWGARSHVVTASRGKRTWSLTGLTREGIKRNRAEWTTQHVIGSNAKVGSAARFRVAIAARSRLRFPNGVTIWQGGSFAGSDARQPSDSEPARKT